MTYEKFMGKTTKQPYISTCCIGQSEMKKWRTRLNRKIRRNTSLEEVIPTGNFYRKTKEIWKMPNDGKMLGYREKDRRK